MAIRTILQDDDNLLRKISRKVTEINKRIITLLDDMAETMKHEKGVGLAAPQVGVLRRIVVLDNGEGSVIEMINPHIIKSQGECIDTESCLSVNGRMGIKKRPQKVKAQYIDRNGDLCEIEAEHYFARAICHEIDHLDGILYIDDVIKLYNTSDMTEEDVKEIEKITGHIIEK